MLFSNAISAGAVLALLTPALSWESERRTYNGTSHCAGTANPSYADIIPLNDLATLFPNSSGPQDAADFVQIRNTAMLYPLVIDGKNFGALGNLFTQDVVANLSQGPVINGLQALNGALAASVATVASHHNLGTQYINIASSGCSAESITYFHASLLGTGGNYGQVWPSK